MKKSFITFFKITVSIFLLLFLYYNLGVKNSLYLFLSVNTWWLLLFFVTIYFIFFASALSIWILIKDKHLIGFCCFVKQYFYAYLISFFVPGQIGDFSLVVMLKKKYKIPMRISAAAYSIDKSITLLIYFIAVSIGIVKYFPGRINIIIFIICGILIFICIFLFYIKNIILWKLPFNISKKIIDFYNELLSYKEIPCVIIINLILTLFKWLFVGFGFMFVFKSFGVSVSLISVLTIPIMATFIGYIPISAGGVGVVEVVAISGFSFLGLDQVLVLNVYILSRVCQYFACLPLYLFYGHNHFIKNKKENTELFSNGIFKSK